MTVLPVVKLHAVQVIPRHLVRLALRIGGRRKIPHIAVPWKFRPRGGNVHRREGRGQHILFFVQRFDFQRVAAPVRVRQGKRKALRRGQLPVQNAALQRIQAHAEHGRFRRQVFQTDHCRLTRRIHAFFRAADHAFIPFCRTRARKQYKKRKHTEASQNLVHCHFPFRSKNTRFHGKCPYVMRITIKNIEFSQANL